MHPDGLPPSYTLILLFRLLPDTSKDAFDLWQISDSSNNPEVGLTLNRKHHFLHSLYCLFFIPDKAFLHKNFLLNISNSLHLYTEVYTIIYSWIDSRSNRMVVKLSTCTCTFCTYILIKWVLSLCYPLYFFCLGIYCRDICLSLSISLFSFQQSHHILQQGY